DQLWRTGANAATKITFSKDVSIAGSAVPAGRYLVFPPPGERGGAGILKKKPTPSTQGDKQGQEQLRFKAKPKSIPHREHLLFVFGEFNDNAASLDLEWEKVRVTIPIKVDTDKQTAKNIDGIEDNVWRMYNAAARYELDQKKDYEAGL